MTARHPHASRADAAMPPGAPAIGVRIAGCGSAVPDTRLTNADFERMLDTSDEWIVQRTGIRERRRCDPAKGENSRTLSTLALRRALENARIDAGELDGVIVGTVTPEMLCPSNSCRVAAAVGAGTAAAFDISAACCGFVYGLNIANALIRSGSMRTVGVVGCDHMTSVMDYTDRRVSILFGDAAGAAVLRATDDTSRGVVAHAMHADATGWADLYLPRSKADFPPGETPTDEKLNRLQMNGQAVFKFAVKTFGDLIQRTLDSAGLKAEDVDHYICHQSNARILEASRERFGLPEEKLYVNIQNYGNTSAGSVGLCLDELWRAGRVREGQLALFVAFGGGLTWSSSLWRI
ncbi:MAG: ketoacyl-ACP synthase III [Phycisphaerales bacterium]|nr:ketoacyl-ACP synthase III [Phycisphaerales bacterium]